MTKKELTIIGNNALVEVAGIKNIPAKVDTGADSSSIWASNININKQNQLEFVLFAPGYELYTGDPIIAEEFSARHVRNSTGDPSIRYCATLTVKIKKRKIRATFTLADRSRNRFPILIGRKTLQNKFLVDVSKVAVPRPSTPRSAALQAELRSNPQTFHQKYMS